MIIYGSRTITSTRGQGAFHCPQCKMQRDYSQMANTRYFTLYFIPLFPIYKQGEHIQCLSCGGTFGVEVLTMGSAGTGRNRYELEDLRRAMVLLLIEGQRTSGEHLDGLRRWCQQIGMVQTTTELLQHEVTMALQARATFAPFAAARLSGLNEMERRSLISEAKKLLAGNLPPGAGDYDLLRRAAAALGLPPNIVEQ